MQINHSGNQYRPLRINICRAPKALNELRSNTRTHVPQLSESPRPGSRTFGAAPPPQPPAQRGETQGAASRPRHPARPRGAQPRGPTAPRRGPAWPGPACPGCRRPPLTMVPVPPGAAARPPSAQNPRRSPTSSPGMASLRPPLPARAACWEPQSGPAPAALRAAAPPLGPGWALCLGALREGNSLRWNRLPAESVRAPSLAGPRARLDGTLSILAEGKVSPPMERVWS